MNKNDKNRVLFLDIDGPLIPRRAYTLSYQTRPLVTRFDPCAVGMINTACAKQGRKIVIHSSWIRTKFLSSYFDGDVKEHCIKEGIRDVHFHEDVYCNKDISWRYDRIDEWLGRHQEVDDYVILDDEECDIHWPRIKHLMLIDFENGLDMKSYYKLLDGTWV